MPKPLFPPRQDTRTDRLTAWQSELLRTQSIRAIPPRVEKSQVPFRASCLGCRCRCSEESNACVRATLIGNASQHEGCYESPEFRGRGESETSIIFPQPDEFESAFEKFVLKWSWKQFRVILENSSRTKREKAISSAARKGDFNVGVVWCHVWVLRCSVW